MDWKECARRFPFFGKVERNEGGGYVIKGSFGKPVRIPDDRADDVREGRVVLYCAVGDSVTGYVARSKVQWGSRRPNYAQEYRNLRRRSLTGLSWEEFKQFVSGASLECRKREEAVGWKQQLSRIKEKMLSSPTETKEDAGLFGEVCFLQLQRALREGGFEAVKSLAEAVYDGAKHIVNSHRCIGSAIKKLLRTCSWEDTAQLLELVESLYCCKFI